MHHKIIIASANNRWIRITTLQYWIVKFIYFQRMIIINLVISLVNKIGKDRRILLRLYFGLTTYIERTKKNQRSSHVKRKSPTLFPKNQSHFTSFHIKLLTIK